MDINQILPAAIEYQNTLIANVLGLKELGLKKKQLKGQMDLLNLVSDHINGAKSGIDKMLLARKKANKLSHAKDQAIAYNDSVRARFEAIRTHADALETLVDDKLWPLPKYRELLFIK